MYTKILVGLSMVAGLSSFASFANAASQTPHYVAHCGRSDSTNGIYVQKLEETYISGRDTSNGREVKMHIAICRVYDENIPQGSKGFIKIRASIDGKAVYKDNVFPSRLVALHRETTKNTNMPTIIGSPVKAQLGNDSYDVRFVVATKGIQGSHPSIVIQTKTSTESEYTRFATVDIKFDLRQSF